MSKTLKDLKEIAKYAIQGAPYATDKENFSAQDVDLAFAEEMKKLYTDFNSYRRNKYDIFELLQESVDAILPQDVLKIFGSFVEVKQIKQGQKATFKRKLGEMRARQFITQVGLSGIYETFRLDKETYEISVGAIGGAARVDLERMLDGHETMLDYRSIVVAGMANSIYALIQDALINASDEMPTKNFIQTSDVNGEEFKEGIKLVSAYGTPNILCSLDIAMELDGIVYDKNDEGLAIDPRDLANIRDYGYIGKYRGANVIVIPNSFTDETNEHLVINPAFAYIIPGDSKLIKLVMEGNTIVKDHDNADNSIEIQTYKKIGLALVSNNNWVLVEHSGISTDAFDVSSGYGVIED